MCRNEVDLEIAKGADARTKIISSLYASPLKNLILSAFLGHQHEASHLEDKGNQSPHGALSQSQNNIFFIFFWIEFEILIFFNLHAENYNLWFV